MDSSVPNKLAKRSLNTSNIVNNLNMTDENVCSVHNSPFIKVCYTCSLALCKLCLPEHSHH